MTDPTPTQPPQGVMAELRELLARRSDAAERIARSPINLDDVQAYQDADVSARTAALLALPGLLDEVDALRESLSERKSEVRYWFAEAGRRDALLTDLSSQHAAAEARASALLARCDGLDEEVRVLKGSLEGLSAANAHYSARCEGLEAALMVLCDVAELAEPESRYDLAVPIREARSLLAATRTTGGE